MTSKLRLASTGTLVAGLIYACSIVLVVQLALRKYHDVAQTRRGGLCGARDAAFTRQKTIEALLTELRKGDGAYAKSLDNSNKGVIALANALMMLLLYIAFLMASRESDGRVVCLAFGIIIYLIFDCRAALSVLVVILAMRLMGHR